jgi:hypothetical protein
VVELSGGQSTLDGSLEEYHAAWHKFITENDLQIFAESATPTTISWKVADKKAMFENLESLASVTEQVHIGTVNGRFIASIVLHEPYRGMQIIKILERRADSSDPLGLDSIDYLVENPKSASDILGKAKNCVVQKESNDMHEWLSLRFGESQQFEAKFVDHLVLAVAQKELALREKEILASLGIA